jgi:hypothetical protein
VGAVVMVFEDHTSMTLAPSILSTAWPGWSKGVPIHVVTTPRPELLGRRSGWGAGKRGLQLGVHGALSEAAIGELPAGLVPGL